MTKRRTAPSLTDAEEAQIQAQIAADPDNPEMMDAQVAEMRLASEALPAELFARLTRRGRPKSECAKVLVTLRLDPSVVEGYRCTGAGWQVRMGEVLAAGLSQSGIAIEKRKRVVAVSVARHTNSAGGCEAWSSRNTAHGQYVVHAPQSKAAPRRPKPKIA